MNPTKWARMERNIMIYIYIPILDKTDIIPSNMPWGKLRYICRGRVFASHSMFSLWVIDLSPLDEVRDDTKMNVLLSLTLIGDSQSYLVQISMLGLEVVGFSRHQQPTRARCFPKSSTNYKVSLPIQKPAKLGRRGGPPSSPKKKGTASDPVSGWVEVWRSKIEGFDPELQLEFCSPN